MNVPSIHNTDVEDAANIDEGFVLGCCIGVGVGPDVDLEDFSRSRPWLDSSDSPVDSERGPQALALEGR
ncbi:hypothetical protein NDU88_000518 [Pleurodeles waltl]|uniref:Uncharacterized protein n=1 Tax=Pleurodeles waltl TaxID=8319 RepID=A0AAV7SWR0_PLEWA|nr:hypothetical protein NDU88_000518 [Pleurodeles waltl]